ncbi:hypothetical protein [Tetragenococcus halophilus]|uniref:hypothetical protein n=1 Tax=Tetragenococcus halophilus TaxID=51669 RepID=UPI00209AC639|nr:hypothetical protein [Tetragenococcus halophilus]MCO8287258.1 hypothetical protein [Tetragenococcus halophilus]
MLKIEELKYIYNDAVSWLKFIEAKIVFILGVLITLSYFTFEGFFTSKNIWYSWVGFIFAMFSIFLLIINVLGIDVFKNFFGSVKVNENLKNLFFYKEVSELNFNDYREEVKKLNEKKFEEQLISQIYDIFVTTKRKQLSLIWSTIIYFIGLILSII